MSFTVLARKSLSLFTAVGGWRTVAEGVASRALFLVVYLFTNQVLVSAAIAVGGVLALAVVRVCTSRKYRQAVIGLLIVVVSALLAGNTGHGVGFYLPDIAMSVVAGAVFGVSILVRLPAVGLVVGIARGDRLGWRRDRAQRRRCHLCTAMFLAKDGIAVALMIPLYVAGHVIPLGIVSTALGAPAIAGCAYLSWRILRIDGPAAGVTGAGQAM